MEWLSKWWKELFRDVVLTGSGLVVIGSQVIAAHPNVGLAGLGVALTAPSTYVRLKELAQPGSPGSGEPPPPPASSDSPTSSPGATSEH